MSTSMIGKNSMKHHCLKKKKEFYSNLNMEDITNADYIHPKEISKYLQIKNLREYLDLYLKSDALPLAEVFEAFMKMSFENYHLDAAKFFQLQD